MACLIKPPEGKNKGVVSFTTQERDRLVQPFDEIRTAIEQIKGRYVIGLHHNWHDYQFRRDVLFDFSMAGEEDLISVDGTEVPLLPMDACNFSPPFFKPGGEKFWDVLFVGRAVQFKRIPDFFHAVRTLYDRGEMLRVLFLCPLPPPGGGSEAGLRELYEKLFNADERALFTFMTMDFDYPFPLDLETLGHFYRSSRSFVHSAPDERRCRVAAYAWASGIPVVGRDCIGSVLPKSLRRPPFFYEVSEASEFPAMILQALADCSGATDFGPVREIVAVKPATITLQNHLDTLASRYGWQLSKLPLAYQGMDLRLGRHHGIAYGRNRIEQDLGAFIQALSGLSDVELFKITTEDDPENALARRFPLEPRRIKDGPSLVMRLRHLLGWVKRRLHGLVGLSQTS